MRRTWDFLRNARAVRTALEYATLPTDFLLSLRAPAPPRVSFDGVQCFVIFLGIGRSGTTLVGSLLDAHPDVVIANEQNVLKYLHPVPFSRERMFRLLLRNAERQAAAGRPGGGDYRYAVPGQHQGRSGSITVIGEKSRSGQAVEWASARPRTLQRLAETVRTRVVAVHVIRNPWDTIARRSLRRRMPLEKMTREYFRLADALQGLLHRFEHDAALRTRHAPLRLEDLVQRPAEVLAGLCGQIGVTPEPAYLADCARIVQAKAGRARDEVDWPPGLAARIADEARRFDWLAPYGFEAF